MNQRIWRKLWLLVPEKKEGRMDEIREFGNGAYWMSESMRSGHFNVALFVKKSVFWPESRGLNRAGSGWQSARPRRVHISCRLRRAIGWREGNMNLSHVSALVIHHCSKTVLAEGHFVNHFSSKCQMLSFLAPGETCMCVCVRLQRPTLELWVLPEHLSHWSLTFNRTRTKISRSSWIGFIYFFYLLLSTTCSTDSVIAGG